MSSVTHDFRQEVYVGAAFFDQSALHALLRAYMLSESVLHIALDFFFLFLIAVTWRELVLCTHVLLLCCCDATRPSRGDIECGALYSLCPRTTIYVSSYATLGAGTIALY